MLLAAESCSDGKLGSPGMAVAPSDSIADNRFGLYSAAWSGENETMLATTAFPGLFLRLP